MQHDSVTSHGYRASQGVLLPSQAFKGFSSKWSKIEGKNIYISNYMEIFAGEYTWRRKFFSDNVKFFDGQSVTFILISSTFFKGNYLEKMELCCWREWKQAYFNFTEKLVNIVECVSGLSYQNLKFRLSASYSFNWVKSVLIIGKGIRHKQVQCMQLNRHTPKHSHTQPAG